MKFKTETGIILDEFYGTIFKIVEGNPGAVEFEPEDIFRFKNERAGAVVTLAHTHPPQLYGLSARDRQTLKTWTFTFNVAKIIVIAHVAEDIFRMRVYRGTLESKEDWIARGKIDGRKFEAVLEGEIVISRADKDLEDWVKQLIDRSYE